MVLFFIFFYTLWTARYSRWRNPPFPGFLGLNRHLEGDLDRALLLVSSHTLPFSPQWVLDSEDQCSLSSTSVSDFGTQFKPPHLKSSVKKKLSKYFSNDLYLSFLNSSISFRISYTFQLWFYHIAFSTVLSRFSTLSSSILLILDFSSFLRLHLATLSLDDFSSMLQPLS